MLARSNDPASTGCHEKVAVARRSFKRRSGFVLAVLVALSASLAFGGDAEAANFGTRYLTYGSCCSGDLLRGTRANITVHSNAPNASDCVLYSSVVASNVAAKQLQIGIVRCGSSTSLGGTCSLSNNLVKFVERYNGASYVCYPHGAASYNTAYLASVNDCCGTGTWYTYLDGTQYEGQSGYDNSVNIEEWAEQTGGQGACSGWSGSVTFGTWQRWNSSSWVTVASSFTAQTCWSVGALSGGTFGVSH